MQLIIALLLSGFAAAVDVAPGRYIVQLRAGTTAAAHHRDVRSILRKRDVDVESFNIGDEFSGYVATSLTKEDAAALADRDDVLSVEPDILVSIDDFDNAHQEIRERDLTTQSPIENWGLGDISHRQARVGNYVYDDSAGEGQTVYVIDSGIRISHDDFEGRARFGFDAILSSQDYAPDENGHGTHVAGIAVGKNHGVAKKAEVVAVKVLDARGYGRNSDIVKGIDWAVNDIVSRNAQSTCVINLSLGAPTLAYQYSAVENAVKAAWNLGIVSATAAGNNDTEASSVSPARIPETITVGMTRADRWRSQKIPGKSGSNYGPELTLFAPGEDILSASALSDTLAYEMTGTSMATPHVAGLICYLRKLEGGLTSPDSVRDRLVQLGQKGLVNDPRGSPNVLAYNGNGR